MPIEVTMPKLSDTMEEGKILKWMKRVGDPVKIGDVLAEVETDKANMELEAYDEGTLAEVRVNEDQSAPVGAVIAVLAPPGEAVSAPAPAKKAAAAAKVAERPAEEKRAPERPAGEKRPPERAVAGGEKAPERAAAGGKAAFAAAARETFRPQVVRRPEPAPEAGDAGRVKASPLARRLAEEHGLDLGTIRGTGPGGRIVEQDVETALADRREAAPAETTARRAAPAPARAAAPPARGGRLELSRIRRTTAKRMGESKREVPHFYVSAEVAMDDAVRLKDSLAALGGDFAGVTFTHLVVKAAALALVRVPEVNASYDGDALVLHDAVNVGIATAVDEGLMVPVLHHVDREPLAAVVRQARGLVERTRAGRFAGDDLSGATFTVSNLGMLPVTEFAAIINQPQAAILAVGAIRDVPVVRGGAIVPGKVMAVTLSADHRVIDGVIAGRFLRELKMLLENPIALLV
ncbi:MAG TPA: dihydrolipoamide acetyltransferase family protein [Candidatus Binatia bacterium]|nr:dihydrolipoamide acetyltransferase family protein [Candidatus Binatia bacterium]